MDYDKIIAWTLTGASSLIAFLSWRSKAPVERADGAAKLGESWEALGERYEQRFTAMDATIKNLESKIDRLEIQRVNEEAEKRVIISLVKRAIQLLRDKDIHFVLSPLEQSLLDTDRKIKLKSDV